MAKLLAAELRPGDSICLKGDEGAGKGVFVREFIRAVYSAPDKVVAAPTNTLVPNTYTEHDGPAIQHYDLSGIATPSDADRQQLVDSFPSTVSLIEAAERLQEWGAAPEQRLAVWIRRLPGGGDTADASVRLVTVVPHTASWEMRAGLLHYTISRNGAPEGLVMLSDDMGASMIKGLPESMLLVKA